MRIPSIQEAPILYQFEVIAARHKRFETLESYPIEKEDIPKDPQEFYTDFGPLDHPLTGEPSPKLTPYQYDIWNNPAKTILAAKSQKVGLSTSELLHDFQEMIMPSGRGKECLIIGQTLQHAVNHLYTLKLLIAGSKKYSKYLIVDSKETQFREQQTKVKTMFLRNADDDHRPTTIMALPFKDTSIMSWKYVAREHVSDPSVAPIVDDEKVYAAIQSRTTNTDGRIMIEGPPNGPFGHFFKLYEQFKNNENPRFQVYTVTIYDALKAGLVTKDFIDQKRIELGPKFSQTYEASFIEGAGDVFDAEKIDLCIMLGQELDREPISPFKMHIGGVDPGFAKVTPLYIAEIDEQRGIVRLVYQYFFGLRDGLVYGAPDLPNKYTPEQVADKMKDLYNDPKYGTNLVWFVDGADTTFVNQVKATFLERRMEDTWKHERPGDDEKVIPINFKANHTRMLSHLHNLVSQEKLAIPASFERLIASLRTARATDWDLDKKRTINDDDLDSLRLLLEGEVGIQ